MSTIAPRIKASIPHSQSDRKEELGELVSGSLNSKDTSIRRIISNQITTLMIQQGILNPDILHLIARVRHTNTLVIADWAFPYWPEIETVDISLTRGVPTILQVLELLKPNFKIGRVMQAKEFLTTNSDEVISNYQTAFGDIPNVVIERPVHIDFKKLVPSAIGLIRTGDTTSYGNIVLESV